MNYNLNLAVRNKSIPHHVCAMFVALQLMPDHSTTIQPLRHAQDANDDGIWARTQFEQFDSNCEFKCFGRLRAQLVTSFVFSSDCFCIS